MALKFRRGTTAQKSGSLAFGEPYVNTTLGTLQIGGQSGDITLLINSASAGISGSSLDITGNAKIDGNLSLGGQLTIGDNTSDTVNVVASLSSSLIPSITNTFDLGSATKIWRDLYLSTGSIKLVNGSGVVVNTITNANIVTTDSIASGSITLTNSLPTGVVSGSSQVSYVALSNIPAGIISSSAQIDTLFNIDGLVSGSSQITAGSTTNFATDVKTQLNSNTVISGSSQVELGSASGNIALATQTTGDYVASLVAGTGVTITNNTGENATPTIAIGQSVATNATPTFGNLTISGTITATGDITAYYTSDRRHKNNIQLIPDALQKVTKLNGVTWEWNDDVNEVTKSTPKTGLIAQEVQEVLPEVVTERVDGFLALDYSKMMGLMVEAIKQQQTQIHNLTLQVEELKKQRGL